MASSHKKPRKHREKRDIHGENGEGGIRTREAGVTPLDGLANRWFQPLTHLSRLWSAVPWFMLEIGPVPNPAGPSIAGKPASAAERRMHRAREPRRQADPRPRRAALGEASDSIVTLVLRRSTVRSDVRRAENARLTHSRRRRPQQKAVSGPPFGTSVARSAGPPSCVILIHVLPEFRPPWVGREMSTIHVCIQTLSCLAATAVFLRPRAGASSSRLCRKTWHP